MIRTILEIYFGFNLLLTGLDMSDNRRDDDSRWVTILGLLLNVFFSSALFLIASIIEYGQEFAAFIGLTFLWKFHFTEEYRNITSEHIHVLMFK